MVPWGRWFGGSESDWTLSLVVTGLMGLATAAVCWPGLLAMAAAGEELRPPPTWQQCLVFAESALFAIVNNLTYFVAIALLSPLVVSLGVLLSIPVGALADWCVRGKTVDLVPALGMLVICIGFVLMVVQNDAEVREKSRAQEPHG